MAKLNEVLDVIKVKGGQGDNEGKKKHPLVWIVAAVGAVAAVGGAIYGIYKHFSPKSKNQDDGDFEDAFEGGDTSGDGEAQPEEAAEGGEAQPEEADGDASDDGAGEQGSVTDEAPEEQ